MKKTIIVLVLSGLILSACNREESIDDIDKKAVDRWQALIDNNFEKAYEFIVPSYRELENLTSYQSRIGTLKLNTEWHDAEFYKKDCNQLTCEVTIKLNYTYQFPKRGLGKITATTEVTEHWINHDGRWYFVPSEEKKL